MQKKNLYTVLSAALCIIAAISAQAQVSITLPAANIVAQSPYSTTVTNGTTGILLLGGSIYVANATGGYPATPVSGLPTLPLAILTVQAISVGPVNLLNSTFEVTPDATRKKIFAAGVSGGGTISSTYKIITTATTWQAGTYEAPLLYTADGLGNSVTPPSQAMSLIVPAFISTTSPVIPNTTINVNNLSFFTNGISISSQVGYHTTVPTLLKVKTAAANFTYTSVPAGMSDPSTPVGKMTVALTGTVTGPTVALASSDVTLSPAAGISVTSYTANNNLPVPTFSISAADLKSSFVNAGTYDAALTYTIAPFTGTTPASITKTSSMRVTVASLAAFTVPTTAVNLNFGTAADYKLGVNKNVPAQLTVSSTLPYNITVRANTAAFTNGTNTIPLNLLTISGVNAGDNIIPITLSTTAKNLVSGANPVIGRTYDLKYSIPASTALLNKATGTYATTIVFSYVAP
ncbi:hypothetical protein [Pedobacter hartonius]|uniref:Uncharacterized protein n=1 Tax=Pedobacter hartonius TaxID=425514 RepID=A0A1H4FN63_9SPHI|nr:hypothetical protein [Pedobacter hartonius]SEA98517.1 hypothetical protein SAMN05443550_1089 [Pedobacter hartonius]